MAVRLRLSRFGRKNAPFYRIGAFDSRTRREGKPIEYLGTYNPNEAETDKKFVVNAERVQYWLQKGAQPSDTVKDIIKKTKIQ